MGCGINRRTIESLALAGAFDCFHRYKSARTFSRQTTAMNRFSEQLVRYGQLFQRDKTTAGGIVVRRRSRPVAHHGRTPPVKPAVPWPDAERLAKERELVGMYRRPTLSTHTIWI